MNQEKQLFSMKETCKKTGLSYDTLKYYCNEGLIPHVKRDKNILAHCGISSTPNTPCNPVILMSPINIKIKPTKIVWI